MCRAFGNVPVAKHVWIIFISLEKGRRSLLSSLFSSYSVTQNLMSPARILVNPGARGFVVGCCVDDKLA